MKYVRALISLLLSLSILSLSACKEQSEETFEDKPFVSYAVETAIYAPNYQAICEFEHSVYKYHGDEWKDADDGGPPTYGIPFVLYYGWRNDTLEYLKEYLKTESISETSIYFEKDGERYHVKTLSEEFLSDGFAYYSIGGSIVSFNHHEHLVIPPILYNGCEKGQINVSIYYTSGDGEQLLMSVPIFFKRVGDEHWFSNNPEFKQYIDEV